MPLVWSAPPHLEVGADGSRRSGGAAGPGVATLRPEPVEANIGGRWWSTGGNYLETFIPRGDDIGGYGRGGRRTEEDEIQFSSHLFCPLSVISSIAHRSAPGAGDEESEHGILTEEEQEPFQHQRNSSPLRRKLLCGGAAVAVVATLAFTSAIVVGSILLLQPNHSDATEGEKVTTLSTPKGSPTSLQTSEEENDGVDSTNDHWGKWLDDDEFVFQHRPTTAALPTESTTTTKAEEQKNNSRDETERNKSTAVDPLSDLTDGETKRNYYTRKKNSPAPVASTATASNDSREPTSSPTRNPTTHPTTSPTVDENIYDDDFYPSDDNYLDDDEAFTISENDDDNAYEKDGSSNFLDDDGPETAVDDYWEGDDYPVEVEDDANIVEDDRQHFQNGIEHMIAGNEFWDDDSDEEIAGVLNGVGGDADDFHTGVGFMGDDDVDGSSLRDFLGIVHESDDYFADPSEDDGPTLP